jgi:hypothetical protein
MREPHVSADECERKYAWRPDEDDPPTGLRSPLRPRVAYAWLERDYTFG